jgi:hypothetical protein
LLKIHIIPDLTRLLEVPTALAASIVLNPAAMVESNVEAAAASIQHLEEVPTTLTTLPMPVPTVAVT